METTILTPFTFTFAGVRNCPFWSLPLPCLGTCLLLVCTLLQDQETNTTNFSLKLKLQIRFFFSWSAFSCKKNQFSRWPVHTCGLVSKFKQILQWSLLKYFQKMVASGISVSVCSICNCHAGRYYKIHEMVGFYTLQCWKQMLKLAFRGHSSPLHLRALI